MAIVFKTDLAEGCSYSFAASKHAALRALVRIAKLTSNVDTDKSKILAEIIEAHLRAEYGRNWQISLFRYLEQLEEEAQAELAQLKEERIA